jgi:hypothetical protein
MTGDEYEHYLFTQSREDFLSTLEPGASRAARVYDREPMKKATEVSALAMLLLAGLMIAGCSTANVNPASPRANTGYVDFYTDSDLDLSWEIKCADERTGEMRTLFSEFKPLQDNIVRLAVPPGTHQFQVWVMNQATEGP